MTTEVRPPTGEEPAPTGDPSPPEPAPPPATAGAGPGGGDGADDGAVSKSGAGRSTFRYIAGLDGLRGIGVVLMLLYHAQVSWVGDGALFTIEMFFALSGFLITSLFLDEHDRTNRLDLRNFWRRRFRRLLPAMLAIFLPIALYGWFMASPVEVEGLRGDGFSTLLYVSNWWFIFSGQSYFEQFSVESPFSHTWSLAIEEQFYLLIAIGLFWGFARWRPDRKLWVWLAGGMALASGLWMIALTRIGDLTTAGLWPLGIDPESLPGWARTFFNMNGTADPSRVYYGTDTRLSGIMTGVLMAFIVHRVDLSKLPRWAVEAAAWLGVGGILTVFLAISDRGVHWIYYGGFLVFDALMVLVIVALAAPEPPAIVRMLMWKPFVFLGVLSYSLYVWHLPIFVFLDQSRMPDAIRGVWLDALKIGVSFVVAFASYHWLEQPIRRKGLPTLRWRVLAGVGIAVSLIAFFIGSIPYEEADDTAVATGMPVVHIAGDSMALSLADPLRDTGAARATGVEVVNGGRLGCGIGNADSVVGGRVVRRNPSCEGWAERWSKEIADYDPAAVMLWSWGWELYDRRTFDAQGNEVFLDVGTPEWRDWFTSEVNQVVDTVSDGQRPVVLLTLPCIDLEADTPRHPPAEAAEPHRVRAINDVLREVATARGAENVQLWDIGADLCPDGQHYQVTVDGVRITEDGQHFSAEGADVAWRRWILPRLPELGIQPAG